MMMIIICAVRLRATAIFRSPEIFHLSAVVRDDAAVAHCRVGPLLPASWQVLVVFGSSRGPEESFVVRVLTRERSPSSPPRSEFSLASFRPRSTEQASYSREDVRHRRSCAGFPPLAFRGLTRCCALIRPVVAARHGLLRCIDDSISSHCLPFRSFTSGNF